MLENFKDHLVASTENESNKKCIENTLQTDSMKH